MFCVLDSDQDQGTVPRHVPGDWLGERRVMSLAILGRRSLKQISASQINSNRGLIGDYHLSKSPRDDLTWPEEINKNCEKKQFDSMKKVEINK